MKSGTPGGVLTVVLYNISVGEFTKFALSAAITAIVSLGLSVLFKKTYRNDWLKSAIISCTFSIPTFIRINPSVIPYFSFSCLGTL